MRSGCFFWSIFCCFIPILFPTPVSVFFHIPISLWFDKGDLSLKSYLHEFYSMLQNMKLISQFATILIAINVAVKHGQGLSISWAGLTWHSGKQSYSWKTFVYKSLKGQKQTKKSILYHLSLSINPSKTAKLQLAWYILWTEILLTWLTLARRRGRQESWDLGWVNIPIHQVIGFATKAVKATSD